MALVRQSSRIAPGTVVTDMADTVGMVLTEGIAAVATVAVAMVAAATVVAAVAAAIDPDAGKPSAVSCLPLASVGRS